MSRGADYGRIPPDAVPDLWGMLKKPWRLGVERMALNISDPDKIPKLADIRFGKCQPEGRINQDLKIEEVAGSAFGPDDFRNKDAKRRAVNEFGTILISHHSCVSIDHTNSPMVFNDVDYGNPKNTLDKLIDWLWGWRGGQCELLAVFDDGSIVPQEVATGLSSIGYSLRKQKGYASSKDKTKQRLFEKVEEIRNRSDEENFTRPLFTQDVCNDSDSMFTAMAMRKLLEKAGQQTCILYKNLSAYLGK